MTLRIYSSNTRGIPLGSLKKLGFSFASPGRNDRDDGDDRDDRDDGKDIKKKKLRYFFLIF
jgi:hypothetical protein